MSLVSNIDNQDGDDSEIVFDERMQMGEDRKDLIKMALNEYINERLNVVSQEYKVSQE